MSKGQSLENNIPFPDEITHLEEISRRLTFSYSGEVSHFLASLL